MEHEVELPVDYWLSRARMLHQLEQITRGGQVRVPVSPGRERDATGGGTGSRKALRVFADLLE